MTDQEREHKEKCLQCKYHGFLGQSTMKQYDGSVVVNLANVCCDYILINHERRGCVADINCARFEEGTQPDLKRWDYV